MGSVKKQYGPYRIETGIPIPDRERRGPGNKSDLRIAMEYMNIGDSISICTKNSRSSAKKERNRLNGTKQQIKRYLGYQYTTRTYLNNEGFWELRIWRIK